MHQSCETDVAMFSETKQKLNYLHRRAVKLIYPDTTQITDHTEIEKDQDNERKTEIQGPAHAQGP